MKKFNQIFETAKLTVYGNIDNALAAVAAANTAVQFKPLFSPNGTNIHEKYNVQVAIRNKSKTFGAAASNPDVTLSSGKTGEMTTADALKIFDSFGRYDWDTQEITTGTLKAIGHKIGWNDNYDADNLSDTQAEFISSEVGNVAISRKEGLTKILVDQGKANGGEELDLVPTATEKTPAYDFLVNKATEIGKISNKHKYLTEESQMLHAVDVETRNALAKEIGQGFYNEAPIFGTGLKSKFSVNGIPVIVIPDLSKFLADTDKNVRTVTFDVEFLALKAEYIEKVMSLDLGVTKFEGKAFYDIMTGVDVLGERVKLGYSTDASKVAAVKVVNDF